MDLNFLAQVDAATLKLELAKASLEAAKAQLESAKQAHEDLLSQADDHGVPRAKLKKLAEDRVQALLESGLVSTEARAEGGRSGQDVKKPRKPKAAEAKNLEDEAELVVTEATREPTEEPASLTQ